MPLENSALMEHFLEESDFKRGDLHCLDQCTKDLTEQFLQGNVPLGKLLNQMKF